MMFFFARDRPVGRSALRASQRALLPSLRPVVSATATIQRDYLHILTYIRNNATITTAIISNDSSSNDTMQQISDCITRGMEMSRSSLLNTAKELDARLDALLRPGFNPHHYPNDPLGYAENVLGVKWWSKQQEVALDVLNHPRVFVKASHGVGKTHLAGGLISWHFDSFDPSLTLTTAPTAAQVHDLTWKEVRLQRRGRDMLPKAPRIEAHFADGRLNPGHHAAGYTAVDADAFQGRHEENLFVLFEEATGIGPEFWVAAEGMLSSGQQNRWLAIMNPTDPASPARQYELLGNWHVITISALDHPNVAAQLRGLPKPFPKAIDLSWVQERIEQWCTPCEEGEAKLTDLQWPPLDFCAERGVEPKWYRPGPLFEGKVLGRWPSQGTYGVWSDADWMTAEALEPKIERGTLVEIGCDPARFGDDYTTFHVRQGAVSLYHQSVNGWGLDQTAGRCKQLCREWCSYLKKSEPEWNIKPEDILVKIDVDGLGGGVVDQAGDYYFKGISSSNMSRWPADYPNKRSELWFAAAEKARTGQMGLARLPAKARQDLKQQALSVTWKVDGAGRCQVEKKEEMKRRLGRSPDDMDALNLAYLEGERVIMGAPLPNAPRSELLGAFEGTGRPKLSK